MMGLQGHTGTVPLLPLNKGKLLSRDKFLTVLTDTGAAPISAPSHCN